MCWEKQVRPLTENTRGPIHFLGYQKPGGWNNRNVLSQVLEAICPGSRYPWGWFLLRVEREGCVPCSLLASGGSPAILGILWLVEASLHLCPNLQVFSLDVHLYLNFLVFIGTVVLPDSVQFSLLTQSCPTLCDPMDCSPLGSSVYGISQARILEWVFMPFSGGSSWPRDQTWVSCIGRQILYHWAAREAHMLIRRPKSKTLTIRNFIKGVEQ